LELIGPERLSLSRETRLERCSSIGIVLIVLQAGFLAGFFVSGICSG
jgi:hypothetical protein